MKILAIMRAMSIRDSLATVVFTPINIGPIFKDVLMGMCCRKKHPNDAELDRRATPVVNGVINHLKKEPYFNLDFAVNSLNMIPTPIRHKTMNLEVFFLAALLQRHGPTPDTNYVKYVFGSNFGVSDPIVNSILTLLKIRLTFDFPKPALTPETTLYDYNYLKLAFPYDEFHKIQTEKIFTHHKGLDPDVVKLRRAALWAACVNRKRIFWNDLSMPQIEERAWNNIRRFIKEEKDCGAPEKLIQSIDILLTSPSEMYY